MTTLSTLSLGGIAFPSPDADGIVVTRTPVGSETQMYDGSWRSTVTAVKNEISITWTKISASDLSTIETAIYTTLDFSSGHTLILPNGSTFSVIKSLNPIRIPHFYDRINNNYPSITLVLKEK